MKFSMKLALTFAVMATFSGAANASPETFVIDSEHTFPWFEYTFLGQPNQCGRFNRTSGEITVDKDTKKGKIEIKIDARSIDSGSELINKVIRSEDMFDTKKYPTILFSSDDLQFEGEKLIAVNGWLTIKNFTRLVSLKMTAFHCEFRAPPENDACEAEATAVLKRSDFDIGEYSYVVSDDLTLHILVRAINYDGSPPWAETEDRWPVLD